jgi:hypothetical protein
MELNDLKQAWNEQATDLPAIEQIPKKLEKARQPLNALRQNMRREFYFQVLAMVIVGFLPGWYSLGTSWLLFYYLIYGIMVVVSMYYFLKFYRFYNAIDDLGMSTVQNLLKLYYEIRLHLEMYKSLNYILFPFVLLLLIIIQKDRFYTELSALNTSDNWPFIIAFSVGMGVSVVVLIGITNHWVNSFYGKYARQVKQVLDDLEN